MTVAGKCWNCNTDLEEGDFGRTDSCPKCGRDTHVCKGCMHYDVSSYQECREPQADRVVDKERSNFCDYFKSSMRGGTSGQSKKDPARLAAEALFKKK